MKKKQKAAVLIAGGMLMLAVGAGMLLFAGQKAGWWSAGACFLPLWI